MKRSRQAVLAILVMLAGVPSVLAWTPKTRVRMTREAIRFMPYSLRLALERHEEAVLRGMLEPMVNEDGPEHRPPCWDGSLDRAVGERAAALVDAVETRKPFREVCRRFGELAHFVADAGFPPGASGRDGAARYEHFASFSESRREKFPLVFYGHGDPDLDRGDFRAFTLGMLEKARGEDRELARAYAAAGDPPAPAAFDDRSVPFAIASLSYSRCVTDIVRVWLAAWKQAHGDLSRTPYLEPRKREGGRP